MKKLLFVLPLFTLSMFLTSCEDNETFPTKEGVEIVDGNVEETTLHTVYIAGQEIELATVTTYVYDENGKCEKIEEEIHCTNPALAGIIYNALKKEIVDEDGESSFIDDYSLKGSVISGTLKPELLEQYGQEITADELKELLESGSNIKAPTNESVEKTENGNITNVSETSLGLVPTKTTYVFNDGVYDGQIIESYCPSPIVAMIIFKAVESKYEGLITREGSVIRVNVDSKYEYEKYKDKTPDELMDLLEGAEI